MFDAPAEFKQAMDRVGDAAAAFAHLINDIQTARTAPTGPQRELVLLARSTGAWVLEKAVQVNGVASQLNALFKCVVFSQPLTSVAEHKNWFEKIEVPKYVTINTNDRTLLAAQDLDAVEEVLGCNVPEIKEAADNTVYFDTTHGTEVLSDHDVIMRDQREARYTDASLYGFHLYALHGADPTSELKRVNAFVANQRYATRGFQLWEPRSIDTAFGAA